MSDHHHPLSNEAVSVGAITVVAPRAADSAGFTLRSVFQTRSEIPDDFMKMLMRLDRVA